MLWVVAKFGHSAEKSLETMPIGGVSKPHQAGGDESSFHISLELVVVSCVLSAVLVILVSTRWT